MTKLAMFVPLAKADAAQRLVYGSIDETPDRAREIMDYASAKPAFQAWSEGLFKASGGKSYGNVRAQHDMKKAAGVLREITFDDDAKRINFVAHIVDDQEWAKVEAGVYTGFSPGGSYAKRWADTLVSGHHRYTPTVGELSIVDVPCIPSGTFAYIKADGTEAQVEFVMAAAYEPGNEATKARAEEMAKAAAGTTFKDHVITARADLIAENAIEALAKMAELEEAPAQAPVDRAAALAAAMAKADNALNPTEPVTTALAAYAAAAAGNLIKCSVELAIAPPAPEVVLLIGADMTKSLAAIAAIRAACAPLAKGLYTVSEVADFTRQFAWIMQDVNWEEACEGDTSSPLPQMAIDLVNGLKAFLIAMVQEEVAELLASTQSGVGDVIEIDITDEGAGTMELANKIVDLVKADVALMEKAGARNSKPDAARIQTIHDTSCELGAACPDGGVAEKAAGLSTENDRLTKAVDEALPRLEKMADELTAAKAEIAAKDARIAELGKLPALTKAQLAHDKGDDGFAKADEGDAVELTSVERANLVLRRVQLSRI